MSYKLGGVVWNEDGTMANKELLPLEALKVLGRIKKFPSGEMVYSTREYQVIETALKPHTFVFTSKYDVEKFVKALDVIKEFGVWENNTLIVKIPLNKITENGVESDEENIKKLKLLREVLLCQ